MIIIKQRLNIFIDESGDYEDMIHLAYLIAKRGDYSHGF